MSNEEVIAEWLCRFNERLGYLCGDNEPTPEQRALAIKEANEAVKVLLDSREI